MQFPRPSAGCSWPALTGGLWHFWGSGSAGSCGVPGESTCCCSARPAAARVTSPQRSVEPWPRTATACCSPATDVVQRLQAERQSLQLAAAIARLDRFDLLVLDDISYVSKDQAETSVLFELIAARYERR
jgi:IstB-like ATP binding protein